MRIIPYVFANKYLVLSRTTVRHFIFHKFIVTLMHYSKCSKFYIVIILTLFAYVFFLQVDRLVNRVQSSTLLDDRRDACRALKALSRTYRIEVGAHGMDALKQVLEMDKTDCEIVGLALDTLCNITSPEAFDEEGKYPMYSLMYLTY